jgi:2-polyprenyl-3-methyl-5-hydroxy-6-metoxy-1,4-benzoquinol methylase
MTEVLEHLDDDITFLKNLKNVLKKRGYILLSTPNGARLTTFLSRLRIRIRNWRMNLSPMDHRREYAAWELRRTLSRTGFITMSHAYVYFCPYVSMPYRMLATLDRVASKFQLSPLRARA